MKQPNFAELKALYVAVNEMYAKLGADGEIDTRDPLVDALGSALYEVDNGEYLQGDILDCRFNLIFSHEAEGRIAEVNKDQLKLFEEEK